MSVTKTLAQFIVDTGYDAFPTSVVEAAKIAILDGVANMLAGSTQELASIIGRYVQELGGSPQSSVVGWGLRLMLHPLHSPTVCLATAWTTRFKDTRRPTALRPVFPQRLP